MKTALYRHFDAGGQLLYVGISNDALRRLCQHKDRSGWYAQIVKVDVQWLPTREEALAAESAAIAGERPRWNKRGVRPADRASHAANAAPRAADAPAKDRDAHPLVGMFFHTFKDGELNYQAHVLAVDGDTVLAQMFSWLSGCPTNVQAFPKEALYSGDCKLYPDIEAWREAADRQSQRESA